MHEARIEKYEAEIRRLDELHTELDQLWTKVPRYGYLALLAPVVWYFKGFGWAFVELLVTGSLLGTQAYLIGVRKSENRWNRERLVEDVTLLRAEEHALPSPAPTGSSPARSRAG
jgi:hypothetical protein